MIPKDKIVLILTVMVFLVIVVPILGQAIAVIFFNGTPNPTFAALAADLIKYTLGIIAGYVLSREKQT